MIALFSKPIPKSVLFNAGDRDIEIAVRVSLRARSYRLAVPHSGPPVLTLPKNGRWREAEDFLNRHRAWLLARVKRKPQTAPVEIGETVSVRGVPHRIAASGKVRGLVTIAPGEDGMPVVTVPGAPEHLERRLKDWLKAEALRDLEVRVPIHAARLGVGVTAITMRSQATRWGSCSSSGRLNFNWRLVLAPSFVLDYVAAHEVAHLVEMNHSPAFWQTVERALPDMARGRAWLKAHGKELMAWGG